ncbi:hypothetical protein G6F62_015845 [Rhizopus arrhizus]|nr:hypothetical protein G6F62_015845 [Rhizopus arrhizus]
MSWKRRSRSRISGMRSRTILAGDTNRIADTDVAPEIRVCYDIANGDVYAELINTGAKTADFTVTAMAYRQGEIGSARV